MASYPAGDELSGNVPTSEKLHIEDNDSEEDFGNDKSDSFYCENSLQSVTAPGTANGSNVDVISSSALLHTSTDVSDDISMKKMSSSQCASELREHSDVINHAPSTLVEHANVDVIVDATRPPYEDKDEAKDIAGETHEQRRDEIGDEAERDARNDVILSKANSEAVEEARDETEDIVRDEAKSEAIEESRDEAEDIVREAPDEARDEVKDLVRESYEEDRDEMEDIGREQAKVEAAEEEIDREAHEEARVETVNIGSHEANDGTQDNGKDSSRIFASDCARDEAKVGIGEFSASAEACEEAGGDSVVAELVQNEDDPAISVEEDIWRYILKTKEWTRRIRRLTDELDVEIKESISGGRMGLRLFGTDRSNVNRVKLEVLSLVSEFQDVVRTIEVPCRDNLVHSKVFRLLNSINKLPCYVSVAPELLRITGTHEEMHSCLEKLKMYGVRYEPDRADVTVQKSDAPEQEQPPLCNSHQECLSRQIPVPIEKHLWHFIEQKRESDLRGIEEGFGVKISTQPTNDVATVAVSVSMLSEDHTRLLDLAEEALGLLIQRLCLEVVVNGVIEVDVTADGAAEMLQQMMNSLQQGVADMDVILEIIEIRVAEKPMQRLLAIGPAKELFTLQLMIKHALGNTMGDDAQPSLIDTNDAANGISNTNQKFPGFGMRLGSKISTGSEERRDDTLLLAGPPTATGGPSFRDDSSESKLTAGRSAGRHSANDGPSEPTFSRGTPVRVPDSTPTQPQRANNSINLSSAGQKSSEHSSGTSTTLNSTTKQVATADLMDAVQVYPSKPPPPPYYSLDNRRSGTESDDTNRPELKGKCSPTSAITRSRNDADAADTATGRHSLCSICKDVLLPEAQRANGCNHVICLACVMDYMANASLCCPVCGSSGRPNVAATQPIGGQMLVTYNNASRLPGFENNSKGIIIITYAFKQGYQTGECPNPGQPYTGLTKTAFLPLSPVGNEVLDLLQKAFEARVTFRIAFSPSHPNGELVWNEIFHKENIFGGPKEGGYPDPIYMERVRQDLLAKGIH